MKPTLDMCNFYASLIFLVFDFRCGRGWHEGGGLQGKMPDSNRFWIFGAIGILICLRNEKGVEEGSVMIRGLEVGDK